MHHNPEVEAAADLAVKKVFYLLGVDVEDAKSIEAFREDLRFGRKLRQIAGHSIVGMVGIVVAGLMAALWHGIVTDVRLK